MRVSLLSFIVLLTLTGFVFAQSGHRVATFKDGRDESRFAVYRTDVPTDYVWYVPFGQLSAKIKNDTILFRNIDGDPFGGIILPEDEDNILVEYHNGVKETCPINDSNIGWLYKYTIDDFWYR